MNFKFLRGDFTGPILTLVSGTVLGQVITYALTPLISRIYDPEEMAYLSIYMRIIAFVAVIATGRYELALPLPKRDEHAFSLYRLSLWIAVFVSIVTLFISSFVYFLEWDDPNMRFLFLFLPFGVLFTALFTQGTNWAIRTKNYKLISWSKIVSSAVTASSKLGLGLYNFGYKGLIIGHIAGLFIPSFLFLKTFLRGRKNMKSYASRSRSFVLARQFSDFPKINLPHVLIDLSKDLYIAFYILYAFDREILGSYDFSFRMLKLPIAIIGVSVGQVFFKKCADLINQGESIRKVVRKTVFSLFLLSIVPFVVLALYGSPIFSFVFGDAWGKAGAYSEIMSFWLMLSFIASPVSQLPLVLGKQREFFYLSLVGTGMLIIGLSIGDLFPYLNLNFEQILTIVSWSQVVFLVYVIFWTLRLSKNR